MKFYSVSEIFEVIRQIVTYIQKETVALFMRQIFVNFKAIFIDKIRCFQHSSKVFGIIKQIYCFHLKTFIKTSSIILKTTISQITLSILCIAIAFIFSQCNSLCLNSNMTPSKHISDIPIKSVVFNPTGNKIAYGNKNGWIYILNMQNLDYVTTFKAHSASTYDLDYTKDGKYLISGGRDHKINIWPVKQYSNKGSDNCTNNYNNNIQNSQHSDPLRQKQYAKKNNKTLQSDNIILSIATCCITNPQIFAYAGLSSNIYISNVSNYKIQTCKAHKQGACCIKFNPQGTFFASGGADNIIMLWDLNTLTIKSTLGAHKGRINTITFNKQDPFSIVAGSKDNNISFWDIRQNTITDLVKLKSSVIGLEYNLDGNLISTDNEGRLNLIDKRNLHKSICSSRPAQKFYKVDYLSKGKSQFLIGIVGDKQKHLQTWNINDILSANKNSNLFKRYSLSYSRFNNRSFLMKKNKNKKYNNLIDIEGNLHLNDNYMDISNKSSQNKPKINGLSYRKCAKKSYENNVGISITIDLDDADFDIQKLDNKELDFLNKNKNKNKNHAILPDFSNKKNGDEKEEQFQTNRKHVKCTSKEGAINNIINYDIEHELGKTSPNKSVRDKKYYLNKNKLKENTSDFIYKPSVPVIEIIENNKSSQNLLHANNDNSLNCRNGLIKEKNQQIHHNNHYNENKKSKSICTCCCNKDFCCNNAKKVICCCSACSGSACMTAAYFYDKIPYTQYLVCHSLSQYFLWGFGGMICLGSCCYCTCKICRKYECCDF